MCFLTSLFNPQKAKPNSSCCTGGNYRIIPSLWECTLTYKNQKGQRKRLGHGFDPITHWPVAKEKRKLRAHALGSPGELWKAVRYWERILQVVPLDWKQLQVHTLTRAALNWDKQTIRFPSRKDAGINENRSGAGNPYKQQARTAPAQLSMG